MYTKSYNMLTALKNLDLRQILTSKHHLDSLISVTTVIGSISCLDELLKKIVHYAVAVTGAERGFLFLYSHNKDRLTLEVKSGVNDDLRNEVFSFETYRVSREIIMVVENTGRARIGSQEASSIAQGFSELKRYGVKQALCVPFQSRGITLGFLYIDHGFDRELFREQELELMKSFATLTSLSIENAYLSHKLEGQKHKHISITIKQIPSVPNLSIIAIKGIMDAGTMKHADRKIFPVIEQEPVNLIIDLTKVTCLDKEGILCLVKYLVSITSKERTIKFIRPPQHVYRTIELAGLLKKFDMYDNIGEAVSTFQ